MKLHEIKNAYKPFITDVEAVERWMFATTNLTRGNFEVQENGVVHTKACRTCIVYKGDSAYGRLPVRFGIAGDNLDISDLVLTTLEGSPETVFGNFMCQDNELTSLEFAPRTVRGEFNAALNEITSLVGVSDLFDSLPGDFYMDFYKIKEGGLGLLQIPNLSDLYGRVIDPFVIIQKYLGTDNIIECQSELIEAGFEEYAQL